MGKINVKKGETIHTLFNMVGSLEIVLSGSVRIHDRFHSVTISAGGILGILELPDTQYAFTYEAMEDTVLYSYSYTKPSDIDKVVAANPKIIQTLATAAIRMYIDTFQGYQHMISDAHGLYRFMKDSYDTYLELCTRFKLPSQTLSYMDELSDFAPEDDVPAWKVQYFGALRALPAETRSVIYNSSAQLSYGICMDAITSTQALVRLSNLAVDYLSELSSYIISGEAGDYFDLYSNLLFHVSKNPFADTTPIEASVSKMIIYMSDSPYVDVGALHTRVNEYKKSLKAIEEYALTADDEIPMIRDAYEVLHSSLETILDYSGVDAEFRSNFRDLLDEYRLLTDKNETTDSARKLRRSISDGFYKIYEAAFFKSIQGSSVPTVVKMFFCFGYMDEDICGMNNASALFEIIQHMEYDDTGCVLTIYDWLKLIYQGKEEPSKNEFDMDYPAYLRDQKNNGYITKEQETAYLHDRTRKVQYEIANLFTIGNRITFGRITTFCPILSEHNILRPLSGLLITPKKIHEIINNLRSVDFSLFYRQTIYTAPEYGIQREFIDKEVIPHFILMPNVGTRGSLWQETASSKRDSQGRIMLSIFPTENVSEMLLKLCGEFRWELCKHIQGVYWNDITDPSLTSEYADFFQFYRKNKDISSDVKEKVKMQLQRAKNNYRDAFVADYITWIKYESGGSPRLNKVARSILYKYCPFNSDIRAQIKTNPLYAPLNERYEVHQSQLLHQLELLTGKLTKSGMPIPKELTGQISYLQK